MEFLQKRRKIVQVLRTVIDPDIGMNIIDVGLIYWIEIDSEDKVTVKMSMTTPGCPLTDYFLNEIETSLTDVDFVQDVQIDFVWTPQWDMVMMDERAKEEMFEGMRG